ncbi:unnamed protein product [Arctia plantaginis]|uniref:Uncharacterized protein n=1 Tax=Arctia plantaginis TaxID=874455 RepID=A0A8S0YP75_ARCPL|nr:unnamed protein product [Arctia plantaginis]CAB3228426.1 unnamed protein product [Arctia plantaginis]
MLKKSKFRAAVAALKHKLPWFKVTVPSKVKFTTKITKEQICICTIVTILYLMHCIGYVNESDDYYGKKQ